VPALWASEARTAFAGNFAAECYWQTCVDINSCVSRAEWTPHQARLTQPRRPFHTASESTAIVLPMPTARVIIAGGRGFFGAAAAELLRAEGLSPLVASRRERADVTLDVEDDASLRAALRAGDVLLDAAGPFQDRTTTLVEAALEIGFHVVDIADSLRYTLALAELAPRIAAAGIAVLNACSSVSAVDAALVAATGITTPVRVSGFLAPASRYSASAGTSQSLLRSVGGTVRVCRDGRLIEEPGWLRPRSFRLPPPLGKLSGGLFESADSYWLPRIWPSLREVDLTIDTRIRGFNRLLSAAARRPWLRRLLERGQRPGLRLARLLGSARGCLGVEVEDSGGRVRLAALVPRERGHLIAVAPAVLATAALARNAFTPRGLAPPDRQVAPDRLFDYLRGLGVERLEVETS